MTTNREGREGREGNDGRDAGRILPGDWVVVEPMLDQLLDAAPGVRAALLDQLSAGDAARRAVLEKLVAECEQGMPLLDRPATERFAELAGEEPSPRLPDVLGGRYRLGTEIGRGGMARVYLAEDLKHARPVAVKVVRPEFAESLGRERFLREIAIAARLRHPNIMPLYDSGDADGVLYFVMPHEGGQSLRQRLAQGDEWTIANAVSVLRDVGRALAYAHEQGVVHRDVKPDNVMLSGGAAVVTDFGIAKAFSAAQEGLTPGAITQTGVIIGTPAYMSPEQAMGDSATDHRTDIYAFGCVAYELLTGKLPFGGLNSWEMLAARNSTAAPLVTATRAETPAVLNALIARCLERNPAARPQHAQDLLAALDQLSPAGDVPTPSAAKSRSQRRITFLTSAGVVAIIVAAAFVINRSVNSPRPSAPPATFNAATSPPPNPAVDVPAAAAPDTTTGRLLVVLPMENQAGDSLDYVAAGLAAEVAKRLEGVGGFVIRSGAYSEWPSATRRDYRAIGRQFGARIGLRTTLVRVGDSLEVRATVANLVSLDERKIADRRFTFSGLSNVASQLAAAIAGAVFRASNPAVPHDTLNDIDQLSYRRTLEGWYRLLTVGNVSAARALFTEATGLDQRNARAWAGLSSTWASQLISDQVPFDEAYDKTVSAVRKALAFDSLDGSAWANLGFAEALNDRKLSSGLGYLLRAKRVDPSNPEVYLVEQALQLSAGQIDKARVAIRIARELDPLTPRYAEREAAVELCADRPEVALRLYDGMLRTDSANVAARDGRVRALARAGRYDDAIAAWRRSVGPTNTALIEQLAVARGASGFWAAKHVQGKVRLAALEARIRAQERVSRPAVVRARFEAGDFEGGYTALVALPAGLPGLWRLRCNESYDEVRDQPQFTAIVAQIGQMPLR